MRLQWSESLTKGDEMTHTPPPYKVEQGQGYHRGHWVITAEGMPPHSPLAHLSQICGPEESYPDAQFIVTACNAHEELVAALRVAAELQHATSQDRGEIDCTETTPCLFCSAIAKAEKGG